MKEGGPAYRDLRTGNLIEARTIPNPGGTESTLPILADGEYAFCPLVGATRAFLMPGTIGPLGEFHPNDHSISFVIKLPRETTAEVEQLIRQTGGDASKFFQDAVAAYKRERDARREG